MARMAVRLKWMLAAALLCAACDSPPPDWNSLISARVRDQYPAAQVKVLDARTLEVTLGGKVLRFDSAEIALQCNRGPRDCDRAIDQVLLQMQGGAPEAGKP